MLPEPTAAFEQEEDAANPGWYHWRLSDPTRFNGLLGPFLVRREDDGRIRLRCLPEHRHSNLASNVHGGAILGYVDIAMFATSRIHGIVKAGTAVTLDLSAQFIGTAVVGKPLECVSEVLRETGRLAFLRGLVEQDGAIVASYSGTIRKPSKRT